MADDQIVILQRLIEKKTKQLYTSKIELERSHRFLEEVHRTIPGAFIVFNDGGEILSASAATGKLLGYGDSELEGEELSSLLEDAASLNPSEWDVEDVFRSEVSFRSRDGGSVPVWLSASAGPRVGDQSAWYMIIGQDLRERRELELQLRHTQKLESLGQLAAGIAHEINTPVQFVGSSIVFLEEGFEALAGLLQSYEALLEACAADKPELGEQVAALREDADIDFVLEETPKAIHRCSDGLGRVASIVKAFKSFSHPGKTETAPADLNAAIQDTLVIATNEYKYVAALETEFGELPPVPCCIGDINQVVLNLVVNGAHAIRAKQEASNDSAPGTIRLRTLHDGDRVVVSVSDSGDGVPAEIQHRIFEPFFTTKGVGEGTGQGLALAHKVMHQHGGSIRFETTPDEGTTFFLELPLGE